jgi:mono/diheme cytochrome c family protein
MIRRRARRPACTALRHVRGRYAVDLTALTRLGALAFVLAWTAGARAADAPAYAQGAAAFQANCALCHGPAGAGIPALAPPLTSYPARYAASPEGRRQLAITLLYGMFGDITVGQSHFNAQMPEFARLDDATLAATLNFVVFDLAHAPAEVKPLTGDEIAAERAHPLDAAGVREHRKSLPAGGS